MGRISKAPPADADLRTEELCLAYGCASFLRKPVEPEGLYYAVQHASENAPRSYVRLKTFLRVEVDGVVGPDTLAAAFHASPMQLIEGLTTRRILYYTRQTMTYPYKLQWLNGWIRRSIKVARRVPSC